MQKTLIVCAALAAATAAHGLPTHYAENSRLKAHSNISSRSTLVGDSEDPSQVWVLPPNAGEVQYKGISKSGNLGFCESVQTLFKRVNSLEKKMEQIDGRINAQQDELARMNKVVQEKRDELAKQLKNPHMKEISDLETNIIALDNTVDKLIDKLGDAETEKEIEILDARIKEYQAELRESKQLLRKLKADNRVAYNKYSVAKQELDSAKENLDSHNDYLLDLHDKYDKLQSSATERYKRYLKMEGGIVHLDYDSKWGQEIANLQSRYSDMRFTPIPTYNSRVIADFVKATDADSYFESLPSLLRYNVNGNGQLPYGVRLEQDDKKRGSHSFPELVTIDLVLNLVGACPVVDKDFFSSVNYKVARDDNNVPLFAISTVYEYDLAYKYVVEAKYNLWKFYEQVVTRGTKGGFFSSKSYVDVVEKKFDKDAFDFKFLSETPVPSKEIERIRKEVKAELTSRVLTTIAEPDLKGRPDLPGPGSPPKTGAVVIGNGLNKICGTSIYCQVGGWVFRVAGSIWGNSKTETKIRKVWNRTATERWDTTTMTPRQATATYRR